MKLPGLVKSYWNNGAHFIGGVMSAVLNEKKGLRHSRFIPSKLGKERN